MVQAQEWLDKNYPVNGRNEIKKLDIHDQKLEGSLDLSDFINLEELDCSNNKLTSINIEKLPNISHIHAIANSLPDIDFLSSLDIRKVKCIEVGENNFLSRDLSCFSRFVELEILDIHTFRDDDYGLFHGSLEPLKNLTKLKKLIITATNIDSGLEYLPDSLENLECQGGVRRDEREVKKIVKELSECYPSEKDDRDEKNFKKWRKDNVLMPIWKSKNGIVKVSKKIILRVQLKEVSNKYWSKVEIKDDWKKEAKVVEGGPGYAWFVDKDVLAGFIKYAKNSESKFSNYSTNLPNKNAPLIKDIKIVDYFDIRKLSNVVGFLDDKKLFENGISGKAKDEKAFAFLKLIMGYSDVLIKFYKYDKDISLKDKEWTELHFVKQDLEGEFNLSVFTNLESLTFEKNQLAKLDLSNLKKLARLDLSHLKELKELNISGCHSLINLKPFSNLSKLEVLNITNTNISEGLEYLPISCKKLYCNSNYKSPSTKIMSELDKSGCLVEEEEKDVWGNIIVKKHYNLDKWREYRDNNTTASVIQLERLFVIRGNINQFLRKWNLSELINLQSPEQYSSFTYLGVTQVFFNYLATAGGVLTLVDYPTQGAVVSLAAPFLGTMVGQLKANFYDVKQTKWKDFLTDINTFLDNYNELSGLLKSIFDKKLLGKVNTAVKGLNEKVQAFLDAYDKNDDREISVNELISEREKFVGELTKLEAIVIAIKELETKVTNFKKNTSENEDEEEKLEVVETGQAELAEIARAKEEKEDEIARIKRESKNLKIKKDELKKELETAEITYQQIKKEIVNKQNDLLLVEKQTTTNISKEELLKHLNEEITKLEQGKSESKQKIDELKEKINKIWWQETWELINNSKEFLITPYRYWEQYKNSNITNDSSQEEPKTEIEVKDSDSQPVINKKSEGFVDNALAIEEAASEIRRRTSYHSIDIENEPKQHTAIEQAPK